MPKIIPIVTVDQFEFARALERKLLERCRGAGVLFVGIDVQPATEDLEVSYYVWVGCSRDMDENVVTKAMYLVLARELAEGVKIRGIATYRGIAGDG